MVDVRKGREGEERRAEWSAVISEEQEARLRHKVAEFLGPGLNCTVVEEGQTCWFLLWRGGPVIGPGEKILRVGAKGEIDLSFFTVDDCGPLEVAKLPVLRMLDGGDGTCQATS